MKEVTDQQSKYRVDIMAVQEVRWKGSGTIDSNAHTMYYCGNKDVHSLGTGFIVSRRMKERVIGFKPVSERMCVLRVQGSAFNVSFICAHAPTEANGRADNDQFYEQLELEYDELPKADIKILLGDFNAQLGREEQFYRTIGCNSLHNKTSDNGLRVIEFASSRNLVCRSTWFPRKDIHKQTWISPDGKTRNQIDHVFIEGRHFSSITNVRTYRGANCGSDHMLVVGVLRIRTRVNRRPTNRSPKRMDTEKLALPEIRTRYCEAVKEQLETHQPMDDSIESLWTTIKNAVTVAGIGVIGPKPTTRSRGWFNEECRVALEKRQAAEMKRKVRNTRRTTAELKRLRLVANKTFRKAKRDYHAKQLQRLDEQFDLGENRKFFRGINAERKGYQDRVEVCKNRDGQVIVEREAVLERWAEYFEELLNRSSPTQAGGMEWLEQGTDNRIPPPTLEEVCEVIDAMKNNKAPGRDNISAEQLKQGGGDLHRAIHRLIMKIWETEEIPSEWTEGVICPLFKKGDKFNCANYRGITLISSVYKVLSGILKQRITPLAEKQLGNYQCGFRAGKSTTDQIFNVRQTMEKMWETKADVHQLFIDFKQAYDSIDRSFLWKAMRDLEIPPKYIRLAKATVEHSRSCVRVQGDLSRTFDVSSGLRQGDGLSPLLFNIALEKVIRNSSTNWTGTLIHKSQQIFAYADDIDVVGRSVTAVKRGLQDIEEAARPAGLHINEGKTKYMVMTRKNRGDGGHLVVDNNTFERVDSFVYLGANVNSANSLREEIDCRIAAGNRSLFALASVFRSKVLQRSAKIRVYKTLLRPIVLYGAEAWTLTQAEEEKLLVFERNVLRRIFGPVQEPNGDWRRRYNEELKNLYHEPNIVAVAKSNRLRWAGHVLRMDPSETTHKIFNARSYDEKSRGRPRMTWISNIEEDLRKLGASNNYQTNARNREYWRNLTREALTHLGS